MANQMHHKQFLDCYKNWIAQQRLDLEELVQSLNLSPTNVGYLQVIINKAILHFENYAAARALLAKHDGSAFLAPSWGSTFENSFLWIGGCRPSMIIRIVYVLCGLQLNAQMAEFLEGVRHGNIGEISKSQLKAIDELHAKTIKEENKLSSEMATVQERIADEPLVSLAIRGGESSNDKVVKEEMDIHALDLYSMVLEADKLRLNVLKGMLEILTPLQGIEFLLASKKLHLSIHEWGKRRDLQVSIGHQPNSNIASTSRDPPPPEN